MAASPSPAYSGLMSVDRRSRRFRSLRVGFEPTRAGPKETAMRIRKAFSLMLLPAVLLPGLTAHAAPDASRTGVDAGVSAAPTPAPSTPVEPSDGTAPAPAATGAPTVHDDSLGVAMTPDQLDQHRGGDALIGQNYLTGAVTDNVANRVSTGSNSIADGSFANSSGLPTVIQNTGANVLIQNATVLNVHFGN
ncbi:hypothetical protein [Burkholderia ubonensis]|uniref:hypothetical protein n=1 Tax=Burkholderia ubonensis TaxID=101571 RepID=UPI001E32BE58|nr:hypothetical protein [Burkholderia ubonensis]